MAAGTGPGITYSVRKEMQRGFINDNILHSPEHGDIHYSSYIPEAYDGTKSYALFVTLPGWEGLYFQGVGANMVEDFGVEAIQYNDEMIFLSTQLNDWGETSADQAIALTEFFLAHYNIDPERNRFSCDGEKAGTLYSIPVLCNAVGRQHDVPGRSTDAGLYGYGRKRQLLRIEAAEGCVRKAV